MFKQRFLTALVLIPLILAALYFGNFWLIGSITAVLLLGCGYEWTQLIPLKRLFAKLLFLACLVLACYLIGLYFIDWLEIGLIIWGVIAIFIVTYPASQRLWGFAGVVAVLCLLLLPLFGMSILAIFDMHKGRSLLVYLLSLVWAADIGAYLVGKYLGRHKLIPAVSPGKTWEGAAGGLVLTLIVSLIGYYYFTPESFFNWILHATGIFFVALIGDLFISLLKRRSSLKDTGQLLPGHGGVLDRLDSLIAAAPFFYLGMLYLPHGG